MSLTSWALFFIFLPFSPSSFIAISIFPTHSSERFSDILASNAESPGTSRSLLISPLLPGLVPWLFMSKSQQTAYATRRSLAKDLGRAKASYSGKGEHLFARLRPQLVALGRSFLIWVPSNATTTLLLLFALFLCSSAAVLSSTMIPTDSPASPPEPATGTE